MKSDRVNTIPVANVIREVFIRYFVHFQLKITLKSSSQIPPLIIYG